MNTIITVVLAVVAISLVVYLFNVSLDKVGNEKGKCNSEDYEIADKVASRKN